MGKKKSLLRSTDTRSFLIDCFC